MGELPSKLGQVCWFGSCEASAPQLRHKCDGLWEFSHLLLPLLHVLFFVAHLHHPSAHSEWTSTYAVHMNNSYLPLVCIPCSIPPCHWKTSCQLFNCPFAVIPCRGGGTKAGQSSRPVPLWPRINPKKNVSALHVCTVVECNAVSSW